MARLTEDVKRTIVMELACYRTPSEVAEVVREKHGIEITRQQAFEYDPNGSRGHEVAKKWKDLYAATRKAFLKDTSQIPIAQRAYRLRELNDMAQRTKANGNYVLAAQLMEQAAKESGDVYTNRQKVDVSGKLVLDGMSDEQINARAAALVRKATANAGGGD